LDFTEVDRKKLNGCEHYKFECSIRNHKEEAAEVHFEHYVWGIWEMVYATHEYSKKTSGLIEFSVNVLADSEIKVEFEYKIDRRTEVIVKK